MRDLGCMFLMRIIQKPPLHTPLQKENCLPKVVPGAKKAAEAAYLQFVSVK